MKRVLAIFFLLLFQQSFGQLVLEKKYKADESHIQCHTFTPDAKQIIVGAKNKINLFQAGSTDQIAKRIDTDLNRINSIQFISAHEALITSVAYLSYYWTNKVQYVNIEKGAVFKTIEIDKTYKNISKIEAVPGNSSFVFINNGSLYYHSDSSIKVIDNINVFNDIDYSPKTKLLYGCTQDGKVIEFNMVNFQYNEIFAKLDLHLKKILVAVNGKKIVLTDKKNNLLILDKDKNYSPIQLNNSKNRNSINNLAFSHDTKYLATTTKKQFQIWNITDNFLFSNQRMKKSGYYGADIQFDPTGKYLAISSMGSKTLRLWNCQKLNISPSLEYKNESDKTPPQIVVTNPRIVGDKVSVTNESITLEGLAIDNFGTKSVAVNGTKCQLAATGSFEINMDLALGNNFVSILATDINGNTETKKFSIIRKEFDLEALSFESKNHLLIISIDQYKDWPQLSNAVSDAKLLQSVLHERYDFDTENIISIQDSLANKQNIINGFKELIANVSPNDNVIIYFSGHGYFDPEIGEGYWVPAEAQKGNDADYLPNSFMMQLMKKINSKHLFLIADACFSGSLFSDSHRGYTENVGNFKSRWGLASGRLELVSDGAAGTQSPFNKYLVQFLTENEKEAFAVSELVQYVKINVANTTNQAPVGNPLQNIGDEGGEFIFKLK